MTMSSGPRALIGRDGWLFLTGDSNATVEHSTGQRTTSEALVRGWQRLLDYRQAWLSAHGAQYCHVVVPNKEVVYARHLPPGMPPISDDRLISRLTRRLATMHSPVRLRYTLEPLLAAAEERDVYSKTDTHWNGFGAYHAYRDVMAFLGVDRTDIVDRERLVFSVTEGAGDIGSKIEPAVTSEMLHCNVRDRRARVVSDNAVANNGRIRRTRWEGATEGPKLLIFHDSFHNWTLPFFAESFPETVSVHNFQLDHDIVSAERPDFVVTELTERFMARLPDDITGSTTDDFIRMKEAGQVAANL